MKKTSSRNHARIFCGAAAISILGACGGGGDGGNINSGISYNGSTNPATLTTSNGADLATEAFAAGAGTSALGSFAGTLDAQERSGSAPPRTLALYHSLLGFINRLEPTSASSNNLGRAVQTYTDTVPSQESCGGNTTPTGEVQVNFTFDDVTGSFSGSALYNNYCEAGETLTGSASLNGQVDPMTEDFINMTISTNSLTLASSRDNYTIKGDVSIVLGNLTQTVSIEMVLRDNTTQKTQWLNNFVLAITPGIGSDGVTISGRYYNPDEGYVTLATPLALEIMSIDDYPSSGTLTATGANGKATLSALSNTSYRVDVDLGDDGSVESTVTGNWADL